MNNQNQSEETNTQAVPGEETPMQESADSPKEAETAPTEPEAAVSEVAGQDQASAKDEQGQAEPAASEGDETADASEPAAASTAEPAAETEAEPAKKAEPAQASASDDDEDDDELNDEDMQGKSFEELLEQYDQFRDYRPGEDVTGTVVSIGEQEVVLDIGARVEGMIPTSELRDKENNLTVKDGESVTAMVLRFNPEGQYIPLSFERARIAHVWDEIEQLASEEKLIEGTIIEKVKGGFIVDVGVRAFLPTSQATLKPQKDYQELLGKRFSFSILKIQRRRGNLILSRKELLQAEYEEKRTGLFEKLQEGALLQGVVKNITDYGNFIDLGGLDGLLHISDMSWGRINHPKDMVELGQELEVKVLRFDPEKEKVSLGLKQCTPDPWLTASEVYPPRTVVKGKVLNLTSYGAFVELEPGVEGMIHVSELSWTKKVRNPAQVLQKDQEVTVQVLDLDMEKRRVSLSLKKTEDNPWESLPERFPVGSKVTGKVRNITEFGAFVEIEDGIDGLVHVSDFRWGERIANPNDYVKKGDEVEVVILAVDMENHKVSLGMKQLSQDPWIQFTKQFKENQVLSGPITRITEFGVFIRLNEQVEGLIRNNELDIDRKAKANEVFEIGHELQAVITRVNNRDRKVDLSVRRIKEAQEREALKEYTQNNNSGGATMADVMGDLKNLLK